MSLAGLTSQSVADLAAEGQPTPMVTTTTQRSDDPSVKVRTQVEWFCGDVGSWKRLGNELSCDLEKSWTARSANVIKIAGPQNSAVLMFIYESIAKSGTIRIKRVCYTPTSISSDAEGVCKNSSPSAQTTGPSPISNHGRCTPTIVSDQVYTFRCFKTSLGVALRCLSRNDKRGVEQRDVDAGADRSPDDQQRRLRTLDSVSTSTPVVALLEDCPASTPSEKKLKVIEMNASLSATMAVLSELNKCEPGTCNKAIEVVGSMLVKQLGLLNALLST